MCQAVDVAVAVPIPHRGSLPHLEAPSVVLEMGFHSLFTTALLFSIIGVYVMTVMGGTRTSAFMRRLPRGTTIHHTFNRLPSILLALGNRVNQRRIPMRRARISAPMATAPRRWAPRPTRHAHLPLP